MHSMFDHIKLSPYQEKFISDESVHRAVFAPRNSGKELAICCDIVIHPMKSLVIVPVWDRNGIVSTFERYFKNLEIEPFTDIISAKRISENPRGLRDYERVYYTEPSYSPIQAHNVIFPRFLLGRHVTYIGTPTRNRNSAIFEFIIRTSASVHYWDPTDVFKPDVMNYLMNNLSPDIYRNEVLALP